MLTTFEKMITALASGAGCDFGHDNGVVRKNDSYYNDDDDNSGDDLVIVVMMMMMMAR